MDLETFIKSSLLQVVNGVDAASNEFRRDIVINRAGEQRMIEFDIAVAVESKGERKGGGQIKVLGLAVGGLALEKEIKNSTVSRIKFGVDLTWRTKAQAQREQMEWENKRRQPNPAL